MVSIFAQYRARGVLPLVLAVACCLTPQDAEADELLRAANELRSQHAAALDRLAESAVEQGLKAEAEQTRAWHAPRDPSKVYVYILPREIDSTALPPGSSAAQAQWHARFMELRRAQAAALYELARKCIRARRASLAYELALAAGREDPDHEAVRRVFGYQKFRDGWYTPFEVKKLRGGQVWHERFGWLPRANVRRYEEGQRLSDNRWISAEDDAARHRDINSGWDIETEHYTIRTNHSIEAGVELGTKLERLYRVWAQLFIRYYSSEAAVAALFDGRPRPAAADPARLGVVYFRDRDDYNRSLRAAMPNIGISIGVYLESTQRAYFFAGDEADDRTLYHEATHQLFQQSRPVAPNVGRKANFWILEGIAMYLESLRADGDFWVLGGQDDERMNAARVRLLRDNFYVPFAELTGYSMEKIQADPRIATLYSQMAGQTHFLVEYDNGRYRDALVAYLALVYSGQDDLATLSRLTGQTYAELDKQYRAFVEANSP
jgi:hypothetical protein